MNPVTIATAVAALALTTGAAPAQQVQVRDRVGGETASGSPGGFYKVGTGGSARGTFEDGPNQTLLTGTFDFEANYFDGEGFVPFLGFCFEPEDAITFDTNPPDDEGLTFSIATPVEAGLLPDEALKLEILWANAFSEAMQSPGGSAAFQAFVWELTEDDAFDLRSGNLQLSSTHGLSNTALQLAEQWNQNIVDGVWTKRLPLQVFTSPQSQDIITVIPAPATAAVAFAGAACLIRRRRAACSG